MLKIDFGDNEWCFVDLRHWRIFSIVFNLNSLWVHFEKEDSFWRKLMIIGLFERLKEVMPDISVHDSHNFLGFNGIFIFRSLLEELVPKHHNCHWYCKTLTKLNPNFHHNLCHCQSKFSAQLILKPEIKASHFCQSNFATASQLNTTWTQCCVWCPTRYNCLAIFSWTLIMSRYKVLIRIISMTCWSFPFHNFIQAWRWKLMDLLLSGGFEVRLSQSYMFN